MMYHALPSGVTVRYCTVTTYSFRIRYHERATVTVHYQSVTMLPSITDTFPKVEHDRPITDTLPRRGNEPRVCMDGGQDTLDAILGMAWGAS